MVMQDTGKIETKRRRTTWVRALTLVLSCIASSGITLGARERLVPAATNEQCVEEIQSVKERVLVLETKFTAAEQAKRDEIQLKALLQEIKSAWGPNNTLHYKGDGSGGSK